MKEKDEYLRKSGEPQMCLVRNAMFKYKGFPQCFGYLYYLFMLYLVYKYIYCNEEKYEETLLSTFQFKVYSGNLLIFYHNTKWVWSRSVIKHNHNLLLKADFLNLVYFGISLINAFQTEVFCLIHLMLSDLLLIILKSTDAWFIFCKFIA